ncbi:MAG: GtrA family protein [Patescibacteria group bacterium]
MHRILKFCLAGSIGAGTQLFFLYLFTDVFHIWYLQSGIYAFALSIVVSFILQKWWTFSHDPLNKINVEIGLYLANALINVVLNTLILYILVDILHAYYLVAQIIASLLIAVLSYFIYKHFIFRS